MKSSEKPTVSAGAKYLEFSESIKDEETGIRWDKGERYEVLFEGDDYYRLPDQSEVMCGISKRQENKIYVVVDGGNK